MAPNFSNYIIYSIAHNAPVYTWSNFQSNEVDSPRNWTQHYNYQISRINSTGLLMKHQLDCAKIILKKNTLQINLRNRKAKSFLPLFASFHRGEVLKRHELVYFKMKTAGLLEHISPIHCSCGSQCDLLTWTIGAILSASLQLS